MEERMERFSGIIFPFLAQVIFSAQVGGAPDLISARESVAVKESGRVVVATHPQARESDYSHNTSPDAYDRLMFQLCKEAGLFYDGKRENCKEIPKGE